MASERITRAHVAAWDTPSLLLFAAHPYLEDYARDLVIIELAARGVPMVSRVPQCTHLEHSIDATSGMRMGLVSRYGDKWEVCK